MEELLTEAELAKRIKKERLERRLSMQAVGDMVGMPRQRVEQAEKSENTGVKLNELRMQILSCLLHREVKGPRFTIGKELESSNELANLWDDASSLFGDLTEEELAQLPEDGAEEHDHYIYGSEKLNK